MHFTTAPTADVKCRIIYGEMHRTLISILKRPAPPVIHFLALQLPARCQGFGVRAARAETRYSML